MKPKLNSSYTKNIIKSFGFTTSDIFKKDLYNLESLKTGIEDTVSDAQRFFSKNRTSFIKTKDSLSRQEIMKKTSNVIADIKDDIKTGKLYDRSRAFDYDDDDDFDWDDIDTMFDDDDDMSSELKSSKVLTARAKKTSKENRINAEMLSRTMVKTTSAMMEQNKGMNAYIIAQSNIQFKNLNTNLGVIDKSIKGGFLQQNELLKSQLDNSAKFYAESLTVQKKQLDLLEKLAGEGKYKTDNKREQKHGVDAFLDGFGGLNKKAYKSKIISNISDNYFPLDDLINGVYMLREIRSISGGSKGRTIKDPLKFLPKSIMYGFLGKEGKEFIDNLNEAFENVPKTAFRRLNKMSKNSTGVLQMIGTIFGVSNDLVDNKGKGGNYEKGRVPWDGKSKKALEEVIPGYLSEIASALTGKSHKFYDYDKGKFYSSRRIKQNMDDNMTSYSKRAYGEYGENVDKLINNIYRQNETIAKQQKVFMEQAFKFLFTNDLSIDNRTIQELKRNGIGDKLTIELLETAYNHGSKKDRNFRSIKNINTLESVKSSYNRNITRDSSINDWMYNGLLPAEYFDSKLSDSKKRAMSKNTLLLNVVDQYNKSIFDYLKEISDSVRRGVSSSNINTRMVSYDRRRGRSARTYNGSASGSASSNLDSEAAPSSLVDLLSDDVGNILDYNIFGDDIPYFSKLKPIASIRNTVAKSKLGGMLGKTTVTMSTIMHKILIGDDSGNQNKSLVEHMQDIFDNPQSRMGQFLERVAVSTYSSNQILNLLHETTKSLGRMIYKFAEVPIIGKSIKKGKSLVDKGWDGIKDDFSGTFKEFTGGIFSSFAGTTNDVLSLSRRLRGEKNLAKASGIKGEIKHHARGTGRNVRGRKGGRAKGSYDRYVMTTLSPGEIVLSPEEAKKYEQMRGVGDDLDDLKSRAKTAISNKAKQGYDYLSNQAKTIMEENNLGKEELLKLKQDASAKTKVILSEVADELVSAGNAVAGSLFGIKASEDKNGKAHQLGKEAANVFRAKTGKLLAGGALGAGASILLGTFGGPLVGAAAGIGISLVKESEQFKKFLFGDKENKGAIPQNVQEFANKYLPDAKKYGITLGAAGFLPMAPFGPVGGLMIGSALSFVKNNESIQKELFGTEGILRPKALEFLDKNSKKMLAGAAVSAVVGPGGLMTRIMLGAGVGLLTTSDKFKTTLLGEYDESTKTYEHGILPSVRDHLIKPFAEFAMTVPKNGYEFLKEEVFNPVKDLFRPLTEEFTNLIRTGFKSVTDRIVGAFTKSVVAPIHKTLEDWVLKPLRNTLGGIFRKVTGFGAATIKLAMSPVRGLGTKLRDRGVKRGRGFFMSAENKLAYNQIRNLGMDESLVGFNEFLATGSYNELEELKEVIQLTNSDSFKDLKLNNRNIFAASDKIKSKDAKKFKRLVESNMSDKQVSKELGEYAIRNGLSRAEYEKLNEAVLKQKELYHKAKDKDAKFIADKRSKLSGILGSDKVIDKFSAYDLVRNIEAEQNRIKRTSKVDEFGNIIEESTPKDRINAHKLNDVINTTFKYREGIIGRLTTITEGIMSIISGVPLNLNSHKTSVKKGIDNLYNTEFMSKIGMTAYDVEKLYNPIINKQANARERKFEGLAKLSPFYHLGNMGMYVDSKISDKMDVNNRLKMFRSTGEMVDKDIQSNPKNSYELTEHGIIELKRNDKGEVEIDDTSAITKRTLTKQEKAQSLKEKMMLKEAPFGLKKKDESKKDKKKSGLLSSLLGGAKGLLGGLKGFGLGSGFGLPMLLGGGFGLFGGITALMLTAPMIEKKLPQITHTYQTKIEPWIINKGIPSSVNVIAHMLPVLTVSIAKSIIAAIPHIGRLITDTIPKTVSAILTGKPVETAAGDMNAQITNAYGPASTDFGPYYDQAYGIDQTMYNEMGVPVPVGGTTAESGMKMPGIVGMVAAILGKANTGSVAARNLANGGRIARGFNIYSQAAKAYSKNMFGRSLAYTPKTLVGKSAKLGVNTFLKFPWRVSQLPYYLANASKGQRKAAIKQAMFSSAKSEAMMKAAEKTTSSTGFKEIVKKFNVVDSGVHKKLFQGDNTSLASKLIDKVDDIVTKLVKSEFISRKLGPEISERLLDGGVSAIAKELGENLAKRAGADVAKQGAKSMMMKGASKAISGFLTLGAATILFAIWDAYDGWHNVGDYLGISADYNDEIPKGLRFMSALIKVINGLLIIPSLVPHNIYLNLYKNIVAKIFGEDKIEKINNLIERSAKDLDKVNSKRKKKLTQKEYNKQKKYKNREKTLHGKAWNRVLDTFSGLRSFLFDSKKDMAAVRKHDVKGGMFAGAGYGPDRSLNFTAGKGPGVKGTYYSQNDSRWANNRLRDSTMRDAGCGPTSIAMALSDATGKQVTPDKIARDNRENLPGYSTWGLFPSVAKKYNLGYNRVAPEAGSFINNLSKGQVVLSGVRSNVHPDDSPFTNAGHIVVAKGIRDGKVEIADPRGAKYSKLYDLDNVLNDMTLGFRYSATSGTNKALGLDNTAYAGGADEKLGDKVVAYARKIKPNVKYSFGAYTPRGDGITTDCSGFTKYVFKQAAGMNIPRSSAEQAGIGKRIDPKDAKAGDLAVYKGHVGIFTDPSGNVIHNSAPGVNVIEGHYTKAGNGKAVNVRRVLDGSQVGSGISNAQATEGAAQAPAPKQESMGFFDSLGNAFNTGITRLYGLPEAVAAAAESTTAGVSASPSGDTSTQAPGGEGIHMKVNRPDNISAEVLESYLRKKGASPKMTGKIFKAAQAATGISAVDILVWAAVESGWGKSRIVRDKNNWFGIGAFDNNPYNGAYRYNSPEEGIVEGAKWINKNYVRGKYKQDTFWTIFRGPKGDGRVHAYSTDVREAQTLANLRNQVYNHARGAGRGPEEAYELAYGRKANTNEDINNILALEGMGPGQMDDQTKLEEAIINDPNYAGGAKNVNYPDTLNGFPYYGQPDSRWNVKGMNMTWTGCGPTSAAMVATAINGRRITPVETGQYAISKGLWSGNNGSSHSIFNVLGQKYGWEAPMNKSKNEFVQNAKNNYVQFALGRPSGGTRIWGSGSGHYLVTLGMDGNGNIINNNPISVSTSGAHPVSAYSLKKSWLVKRNGQPLVWDKAKGFTVSGGSAANNQGDTQNVNASKAPQEPPSFFDSLGGAFSNAVHSLYGLPTISAAEPAPTTGGNTSTGDGKNLMSFKGAVVSGFNDPNMSFGKPQGKNAVAAHNMPFGTILSFPEFKGKLGGGSFKASNGKTYELGEKGNGKFIVADNGGPFFDFDVLGWTGGKKNTDVDVVQWGDGPMAWTMTKAYNLARTKHGTLPKYQNAFNQVFTKYGGFKTTKLTKFSSEDANNPVFKGAGRGYAMLERATSAGMGGVDDFFEYTLNARKSSGFGPRNVMGMGKFHTGVDYDTNGDNRQIQSPISGTIKNSTIDQLKGRSLTIEDDFGNRHHFDHLSNVKAKVGQRIQPSDVIGITGSTGKNAYGNHLHYEITDKSNIAMNPTEYMEKYGSFGGVENRKGIRSVDDSLFRNKRFNRGDNELSIKMIELMNKISNTLLRIDASDKVTAETIVQIIKILAKFGDKIPKEAKKEISNIADVNKVFSNMIHNKGGYDDTKLPVDSIDDMFDVMQKMAIE